MCLKSFVSFVVCANWIHPLSHRIIYKALLFHHEKLSIEADLKGYLENIIGKLLQSLKSQISKYQKATLYSNKKSYKKSKFNKTHLVKHHLHHHHPQMIQTQL